jgi:hypothetical protein
MSLPATNPDTALARVIRAWARSDDLAGAELTSRQLLARARGDLRTALHGTTAKARTSPAQLGKYLADNAENLLCEGYRIKSKFDSHAKLKLWFIEPMSADDRRAIDEQARAERDAREAIAPDTSRAATVVVPHYGAFSSHDSAARLQPAFARFSATARVDRFGEGYAIFIDAEALEARGRVLDDLHAVAERLMLTVQFERNNVPTARVEPAEPVPAARHRAETDPFVLIEATQARDAAAERAARTWERWLGR